MSNELGEFLRARRLDPALQPATANSIGRRRLTGLRREEVAAAAGISVDYYTRLEQGREHRPSDSVIDALARVLHLPPDATDHLRDLRGSISPKVTSSRDAELEARMAELVDALSPNPAYVLDRLSNMIAVNDEGLALYEGFADLEPERRNTCRYLLTDPRARHTFIEWEDLARGAVANLRAANGSDLHDPHLLQLVAELQDRSPIFAGWWGDHIVQRRRTAITHLRSATGEVSARRFEVLQIGDEGLRLTLWMPNI